MHCKLVYLPFIILLSLPACRNNNATPAGISRTPNADRGEKLFMETGCITCHSLNGVSMYGPPLNSIIGMDVEVTRNGKTFTVTVDREYLLRSLKEPGFEKVSSFRKKKMPVINLPDEDIQCLVDYIEKINRENGK
jgi:cytochrome c oxidase subunit 2